MTQTLLNGARVRVERPRALRYGEVLNHLHDRREEDRDWEEDEDGRWSPFSLAPCSWVAQVEAAAMMGVL